MIIFNSMLVLEEFIKWAKEEVNKDRRMVVIALNEEDLPKGWEPGKCYNPEDPSLSCPFGKTGCYVTKMGRCPLAGAVLP